MHLSGVFVMLSIDFLTMRDGPPTMSADTSPRKVELIAMMGFDGYGMSPWMWGVMSLVMVVVLAGVSVLIVWAVRTIGGPRPISSDSPLDVLKRRLAAGEITQDAYERTRRLVQG